MKEYTVKVPIAGFIEVVLEAVNDKEASEMAIEIASKAISGFTIKEEFYGVVNEWELDCFQMIQQGNVFYAPCSRIEIQEY